VNEIASGSATFFWTGTALRSRRPRAGRSRTIALVHVPNPPSIDPGVMAFVWAVILAAYVYFGLVAIGSKHAFAIVMALLAFAGIWLFVRLRGEDRPGV
jgi:hypothetical protein